MRAVYGDKIKPILKTKGVGRIDVRDSTVSFIWVGGFEHTGLTIWFSKNSLHKVIAQYNDYTRQQLFPEVEPVQYYSECKKNIKGNRVLKLPNNPDELQKVINGKDCKTLK